jgi:uncharacterized membrane protein
MLLGFGALARGGAAVPVLSITGPPETLDMTRPGHGTAHVHILDHFLSPRSILASDFAVTQRSWQRDARPFDGLAAFRAVVLWDAPRAVVSRDPKAPYALNIDVVPDSVAKELVAFVEGGGALVIAGGVTCYGDGHPRLRSVDGRGEPSREYQSYASSPLAAILPVQIPEGVTLQPFADAQGKRKGIRTVKAEPMVAGLDLAEWGFDAWHKVRAREGAEVLVATEDGDPLVVRWAVKKGRVVCVTPSPRGNALVQGRSNPVWPPEALLWDRCLRWATGQTLPQPERDAEALARYRHAAGDSPRVPPGAVGEYPFGAQIADSTAPANLDGLYLKYYAELGINHLVLSGIRDGMSAAEVDAVTSRFATAAVRHNLYMYVRPRLVDGEQLVQVPPAKWAQRTLPSGSFAYLGEHPRPCPLSPAVIRHAVGRMQAWMPSFAKHPNVRGAFCDGAWVSVLGRRTLAQGDPGIACYSPWANARFRKAAEQKPPPPVYRKPGYVAPEEDPWLRWCQIVRQDPGADYHEAVARAAKEARPAFVLSGYPGGFEGKSDLMVETATLDPLQESELAVLERLDVRAHWRGDADRTALPIRALVGVAPPLDNYIYPESLRLAVGCALAACARGVVLTYSEDLWSPSIQDPARVPLTQEVQRLGRHLAVYGSMYRALRKPPSPVWMLSSWGWLNSFDNYHLLFPEGVTPETAEDVEPASWPLRIADVAVPATLRAGLPVEFVTEKQLLSDDLFTCKAVLLPGLLYCREGVVRNLERYAARGGKVFVDGSTRVRIEGATVLPVDFSKWRAAVAGKDAPAPQFTREGHRRRRALWEKHVAEAVSVLREHVAKAVQPKVRLDGTDGAWRILENGAAQYLLVLNSNVDEARKFTVTVRDVPPVAYGVASGSLLETDETEAGRAFSLELLPGGWRVVAFAQRALRHVRLARPRVERDTLRLSVALFDESRAAFRASVPVRVTLYGADGAAFTLHRATSDGRLTLDVPIAGSVPVPARVAVTELFTGKTVARDVVAR